MWRRRRRGHQLVCSNFGKSPHCIFTLNSRTLSNTRYIRRGVMAMEVPVQWYPIQCAAVPQCCYGTPKSMESRNGRGSAGNSMQRVVSEDQRARTGQMRFSAAHRAGSQSESNRLNRTRSSIRCWRRGEAMKARRLSLETQQQKSPSCSDWLLGTKADRDSRAERAKKKSESICH